MTRILSSRLLLLVLVLSLLAIPDHTQAQLKLHSVFSDGMVLQRDKPVRIFGFAKAGDQIKVSIGALQTAQTEANEEGFWTVEFESFAMGSKLSPIKVHDVTSDETATVKDVLLGDVWVLGGQSNMEFELRKVYDGDLEILSARFPEVRLLTVPKAAGPERRNDFPALNEYNSWANYYEWKGRWDACTPETVTNFSAIGYVFGRRLHLASGVPIGLIDASRGGTTVETWTSRESLEQIPDGKKLVALWDQRVAEYDPEADLAAQLANWEKHAEQQRKAGKQPREKPTAPRPGPASDMNRPANCFNQMLATLDGLAVRGVIWHQGYNNALGDARPRLYQDAFKAMIRDWRNVFRDDQLPFGIVGFSAGGEPQTLKNFEMRMVDAAPFIREAQLMAAREMDHVGFVANWDQQMNWYHPFKKVALGERISRWALAETMGARIPWQPAICEQHEIVDDTIVLTFDRNVETHDGRDFQGFAIAGEDRHFYPASAKPLVTGKDNRGRDQIDRKRLVISNPLVQQPVAVRHAWARNPIGNGVNGEHQLRTNPIPCFRTDNWDYPEAPLVPKNDPAHNEHRQALRSLRNQAQTWVQERRLQEAQLLLQQNQK